MMQESVLIVGGGNSPGVARLREWAARFEQIIAADAGLHMLNEAGIEPDHLVGDLDSVSALAREALPGERQSPSTDQDNTDLEKAILLALELGMTEIGLAGATGGRLDHSVNAISMILRYHTRARFVLLDEGGEAHLVLPPGTRLTYPQGTRVSLIPVHEATAIYTTNLRYHLSGTDLRLGGRDGISNEVTATPAEIKFTAGALLVYRQTDPAV